VFIHEVTVLPTTDSSAACHPASHICHYSSGLLNLWLCCIICIQSLLSVFLPFRPERACSSKKVLWSKLEDSDSVHYVIPVWWGLKEFQWTRRTVEALWWCIAVLALVGLAASLQYRLVCYSFSRKTK
jgi:hypothetical protein